MDKKNELPEHARLVVGTKDTDTSMTVSLNCYIEFVMKGVDTTLAWAWDDGHGTSDPLNTSFEAWIDGICKK